MEPQRWKRLQKLFEEAAGLDEKERDRLLDDRCGDDVSLRRQVESLILHDRHEGPSFTASIGRAAAKATSLSGKMIGPWRVERELGHGGMGSVYLASRHDDVYRKQVAIKLVRGIHRSEILQRFRSERQILASLEHPHIARLIDGGETDTGEPYVVMEYVAGEPIDAYSDARRLSTRRRLNLFRKVCSAVQYAHRNLIVHRDLKPGNILVSEDGEPKLLDFGIAKLLDPDRFPQSPVTRTHVRVMTPEYASPEQVKGEAITTASDVYSLGVLLYVLLAGRLPYRLTTDKYGELEQAITDTEPDRPSTAVTREPTGPDDIRAEAIGRARDTEPRHLRRRLTGDLDNIVLMALRKEPSRRYASVSDLSEDIRRHLEGLPVAARPSTWTYRTGKFLRRHPVASIAAFLFLATIIGFSALVIRQSRAVAAQRDRAAAAEVTAREEARSAQATSAFLIDLFRAADPRSGGNRNMTVAEILDIGIRDLENDDTLEPKVKVDLHEALGYSLLNLGDYDAAIRSMQAAQKGAEALHGRDSLESAELLHRLGDFLRRVDRYDEAWALLNEALSIRRRHIAGDSFEIADSYNNLAILAVVMGKLRESDELQTASVEMHRRIGGESGPYGTPLNNLALLKHRQGKLEEALALAREARERLTEANDLSSVILAENNIGRILLDMGSHEEAMGWFEACREKFLEVLGPDHRRTLRNLRDIAHAYHVMGDYERSEAMYRDLARTAQRAHGTQGGDLARSELGWGRLMRDMGNSAEAERLLRESLDHALASIGEKHFTVPGIYRSLAAVLLDRGSTDEAGRHLSRALELMPAPEEYPHIETARILIEASRLRRQRGEFSSAGKALATADEIIRETTGEKGLDMGLLHLERAYLERSEGDAEAARDSIEAARPILSAWLPDVHPALRAAQAFRPGAS